MTHADPKKFDRSNGDLLQRLGGRPLGRGLADLLLGRRELDAELLEQLEDSLLTSDVGVDTTQEIVDAVGRAVTRRELKDPEAVYGKLRQLMLALLAPCARPLAIDTRQHPFVIMVVGVNGVGKTTTIGKLAHQLKRDGHSVMLAAADTFRAAAVEQLQAWGARNDVPVVAQDTGADAAAVAHDALMSAQARSVDVLIVDTAGRQHTHQDLMQELQKIKRTLNKIDPGAPHEVLMVLDACTGQNALSQLQHFHETVDVSGLCLTKLDGTAKGGILLALAHTTGLPIRFIGVGEGIDDLRPFSADEFVAALLPART